MIPATNDLQGTWVSRDFPMYHYDDGMEFSFHFSKYATLYLSKGGNNRTYAEGTYEVVNMGEENFNIVVEGRPYGSLHTTLNARLYIAQEPPCFVMDVPNHGLRYFEKI